MRHCKQMISLSILLMFALSGCKNLPDLNPTDTPEPQTVIVFQEGEPGGTCPTAAPCPTCEVCATQAACPTCETLEQEAATEAKESEVAEVEEPEETEIVPTEEPEEVTITATPQYWQPANFTGEYSFSVKGVPAYLRNYAHLDLGCNWQGVAGQVLDEHGAAVDSMIVVVDGTYNGEEIELIALSGMAPAYGPGGFEITLSDSVIDSTSALRISLFDVDGNPLYDPFVFDTYADCQRNLMIVNYQKK